MTPTPVHRYLRFAAALALLTWIAYSSLSTAGGPANASRADFGVYYTAAGRIRAGLPLYARQPQDVFRNGYVYLPSLAIAMRPLAGMSYVDASRLWSRSTIVAIFAAIAIFAATDGVSATHPLPLILVMLTVCRFWPLQENLVFGQVNLWLLPLVSAMFWANSRRHWKLLGALIAVAALVKIWMVGFALYFLLRRTYAAVGVCVAIIAAGVAISFAYVGWQEWPYFLQTQQQFSHQHFMRSHSIAGILQIYFTRDWSTTPLIDSHAIYLLATAVGTAIVVLGLLAVGLRKTPEASVTAAQVQLAFVVVSVLLLVPVCSTGYFIFCLPPIWVMLCSRRAASELPWWTPIGAVLAYFMWTRIVGTAFGVAPNFRALPKSLLLSNNFLGMAILWLTALVALLKFSRPKAAPVTEP